MTYKIKNNFWIDTMPKYSLVLFLSCNILAMIFYPGGNMLDPLQKGYSFSSNFFSDLGMTNSHQYPINSNLISCILFNVSLCLVGVCFTMLFYKIKNIFFKNKILSTLATILGVCAGISFIGVAFTPSNLLLEYHVIFANWAFRFLFGASFLYSILIYKTNDLDNKYAYAFTLFGVFIFIYVYYTQFYLEMPDVDNGVLNNHVLAQKTVVIWIFFSVYIYSLGIKKYLKNNFNYLGNKY